MADPVLLTGAAGFVGRAVLGELVARGIPVHAVSRRPQAPQPGVLWHCADLLTEAGRSSVAGLAPRLIHCAWEVEHGAFWTAPANAVWHHASVDLARRFLAASGQRIVGIGTCAEYDATVPGRWVESRTIAPATVYGQAKDRLRADLSDLCPDGLIWARLFHLYGPGEDRRRLIPSLIDTLRAGGRGEVRAAELTRDYASSAHVARCLVALMDASLSGAVDIGSGAPRSLGDLARTVADALGGSALLDLSHKPGPGDPAVMAPDLERLRAAIAFVPERPEEALMAYVREEAGHDGS